MPVPPKDPRLRQRRNKASTRATLARGRARRAPALPTHRKRWHPQTIAWWRDVWRSPMAAQFEDADRHQLFMVLELLERFWRHPNAALAKEIRLGAQPFGLNPLDRRRLQWEIPHDEPASEAAPAEEPVDPRLNFRVVK